MEYETPLFMHFVAKLALSPNLESMESSLVIILQKTQSSNVLLYYGVLFARHEGGEKAVIA